MTDPFPGAGTPAPARARFGGNGAEYFRIWIVNVALTLATLGIYSAWAKVRREQYFHRHTSLFFSLNNFKSVTKLWQSFKASDNNWGRRSCCIYRFG